MPAKYLIPVFIKNAYIDPIGDFPSVPAFYFKHFLHFGFDRWLSYFRYLFSTGIAMAQKEKLLGFYDSTLSSERNIFMVSIIKN
mgnify:CR=1 FL=1